MRFSPCLSRHNPLTPRPDEQQEAQAEDEVIAKADE
jgi:hypothetical protein